MDPTLVLLFALILLCPLSMYWMRRRHRDSGSHDEGDTTADRPTIRVENRDTGATADPLPDEETRRL